MEAIQRDPLEEDTEAAASQESVELTSPCKLLLTVASRLGEPAEWLAVQ
jgi:hypothetical protein